MAKKALKQIAGTVAKSAVVIAGQAIVMGYIAIPGGHILRHSIEQRRPHVIDEIEKWKNEKTK